MAEERSAYFIGIAPARAFLICEDLPLAGNPDEMPRSMEVFFNPETVSVETGSSWASIQVPGLSHEVHQFSHTMSDRITFELFWDRAIAEDRSVGNARSYRVALSSVPKNSQLRTAQIKTFNEPYKYKEFLKGLTLPVMPGYPPSRVTFIYPRFYHTTGFVTNVNFEFERFAADGKVMSFKADLSMIELRNTFRQRFGANQFFWKPQQGTTASEADPYSNYEFTINTEPQGSSSVTAERSKWFGED